MILKKRHLVREEQTRLPAVVLKNQINNDVREVYNSGPMVSWKVN